MQVRDYSNWTEFFLSKSFKGITMPEKPSFYIHSFFSHRLQIDQIITIIKHSHSPYSKTFYNILKWTNEEYYQAFKCPLMLHFPLSRLPMHWHIWFDGFLWTHAWWHPLAGLFFTLYRFAANFVITMSTTVSIVSVTQLVENDASCARAVCSNPRKHTYLNTLYECEVVIFKHLQNKNDARSQSLSVGVAS